MPAVRVRLVVGRADGCEDTAAVEVPLLDLVVVSLDVRAEAVEVVAKPRLDGLEPRLIRVAPGVDAAHLEEVVLDRVQTESLDVAARLLPVRRLVRLERDELDREPEARCLVDPLPGGVGEVA